MLCHQEVHDSPHRKSRKPPMATQTQQCEPSGCSLSWQWLAFCHPSGSLEQWHPSQSGTTLTKGHTMSGDKDEEAPGEREAGLF